MSMKVGGLIPVVVAAIGAAIGGCGADRQPGDVAARTDAVPRPPRSDSSAAEPPAPPPAPPLPADAGAPPPSAGAVPSPLPSGCPPVGEAPKEPAYSSSGTVVIAKTTGTRKGLPKIKPEDPRHVPVNRAVLSRVFHRSAQPAILECYLAALAECPGLSGVIEVRFEIAVDGSTRGVELAGPGIFSALDACVLEQVRTARFPSGEDMQHTRITWPFVFIPIKDLSAE